MLKRSCNGVLRICAFRNSFSLYPWSTKIHACSSQESLLPQPDVTSVQQPTLLTTTQFKGLVAGQYKHGKFFELFRNVVALPDVLLTASQNLITPRTNTNPTEASATTTIQSCSMLQLVSEWFSIMEMSSELFRNRFDTEACCVTWLRNKDDALVMPNLKLKVLIEAIRMVLEVVFDERFATFAYGGRVGMGRHTAIRYLKNSVGNPSWWFRVKFNPQKFEVQHVNKLCSFIEQKVNDKILILVIKRLFELQVLQMELDGCHLGRGFPQECGLCPILINIYFDGFDKEIQDMKLQKNRENPKFQREELFATSDVFYRPVKIYAVRYLDEILILTSGSKMLIMDLKNRLTKHLENILDLKVNKVDTIIHSAVSEKIEFLGMELQSVSPSVLNSPMTEKAIRARKKYERQKEIRSMELKNARDRKRKKLGWKIFCHVFKKLKQSEGFKFEFQIENDVRELFKRWADEVVLEVFQSLDDRQEWHRKLSGGVFLSLRHIRDQLPQELVNAYDKFQEQVDKHLSPMNLRKAIEEKERREVEEAEKKYSVNTLQDLTRLRVKVEAPLKLMRKAIRLIGFTNHMGRPRPIEFLAALEDTDIIKWYAGIGRRWLDYFCCCHNFRMVKVIVSYHLRFSCILTLAQKHESTKREAIKHYSKDLKVFDRDGNEETYFPSEREVKMMGDRNLSESKPVDGALSLALIRLASDELPHRCIAHFCDRTTTVLYRIRLLQNFLNVDPFDKKKWVSGVGAIHGSLHRKCLPLCSDHISDLYMGRISLQDIDCSSCIDVA